MKRIVGTALLAAGLAVAGSAAAQSLGKGDVVLNVRLTDVSPQGTDPVTTLAGAATGLRSKVSQDLMPTIGVTYFVSDHIALEAIAGTTRHSVRARGPATDIKVKESWVLPPVVTLQYHFAPKARVNPYVGAGVNYMLFYGGSNKSNFHFKLKDGFGAALQAGIDIVARDAWTVNLDAKKVFFDTTAIDRRAGLRSKVTLDPWVLSAGVGYRF